MLAIERRNEIISKLQAERRVVVSELSQHYGVSEETIRRDLDKLVTEGYAVKSYGGAVINDNSGIDIPFNIRKQHNIQGKQKIADQVGKLIFEGDSIILDASSTSVYIAKALQNKKNLTIITNSIELLIELFDIPDWRIISTGGISREGSFALVGAQTDKMLQNYHVDTTIISCKGIDIAHGITDSDEMHAHNKETMLSSARKRILAMDKSKFDKIAFAKIGSLKDIDIVITDEKPEERWLKAFEEAGIECIYPDEDK